MTAEDWEAFVESHDELRLMPASTTIYGDPIEERMRFYSEWPTDDQIRDALQRASRQHPGGVTAKQIAEAMYGADALRTSQRLGARLYGMYLRGEAVRVSQRPSLWAAPHARPELTVIQGGRDGEISQ